MQAVLVSVAQRAVVAIVVCFASRLPASAQSTLNLICAAAAECCEDGAMRFDDWYLKSAAMETAAKTNQWHFPAHTKATLDLRIPDINEVKLVDYDFAKCGKVAERILDRWHQEIASLPQ